MNEEPRHNAAPQGSETQPGPNTATGELTRLPGLIAIGLYMVLLAGTVILGVAMKQFPLLYLIFPALFIAAGLGLLMLFRWAWSLTLAAVGLLMSLFFYQFATRHAGFALVQGLLNCVFFFYLVRAEVRARLR